MSENLMTGIIKERDRVRDLLKVYEELGPAGAFGAHMIRLDLTAADEAIANGDVVAMLGAYQALRGCQ